MEKCLITHSNISMDIALNIECSIDDIDVYINKIREICSIANNTTLSVNTNVTCLGDKIKKTVSDSSRMGKCVDKTNKDSKEVLNNIIPKNVDMSNVVTYRKGKQPGVYNIDLIRRMYINDNKTAKQTAAAVGVSVATLYKLMKANNIKREEGVYEAKSEVTDSEDG